MTGSRPVPARRLPYDAAPDAARAAEVAVETPINLVYATLPHAVMMATPADLEDFALGFSLTEGIIAAPADIRGTSVTETPRGLILDITLAPGALRRHMARRRSLSGRTGCGLCGIESLDQLPEARPVLPAPPIPPAAIRRALAALDAAQPLHRATRAVHAAAWCDRAGTPLLVREDVGRHNALDKLIGACVRAGHAPTAGFVLLTSRCSFEMVEKTATFGAATLVAISAPTSLAIDRAAALGITLIAIARPDGALCFTPEPIPA